MSAGASGSADIEGRAFDAGPEAQNESVTSNTGSNFPTPIDNALKNTVFGAVTNTTWDAYDEQDRQIESMLMDGLISVDEANQMKGHHLSQQGFLSPLVNALQSPWQMYDQVMDDQNNRPNVSLGQSIIDGFKAGYNNLLGMDYGPQVENEEALDAYLDMIGQPRTSSGVLSQVGTNLGGGGGFAPIGMGMGGGPDAAQMSPDAFGMADPLGIDNALATNLYSFPNQYGAYQAEDFNPNLQFNTNIPNPEIENMYNDPDAANRAIDIQLEAIGLGPLSSTEFGPVMDSDLSGVEGLMEAGGVLGGGGGVIGPDFDMGAVSQKGGGELQQALAQRVAETMIAQQAARAPSNNVTIPMSSGPDIVIDVTPPAPQARVAPHRRTAPRPSPVKIAAKSIAKPKAFKKLPKFAQKEIRQGRVPTSGSDNVQDMVRAFLGGQESFGDSGTRK